MRGHTGLGWAGCAQEAARRPWGVCPGTVPLALRHLCAHKPGVRGRGSAWTLGAGRTAAGSTVWLTGLMSNFPMEVTSTRGAPLSSAPRRRPQPTAQLSVCLQGACWQLAGGGQNVSVYHTFPQTHRGKFPLQSTGAHTSTQAYRGYAQSRGSGARIAPVCLSLGLLRGERTGLGWGSGSQAARNDHFAF